MYVTNTQDPTMQHSSCEEEYNRWLSPPVWTREKDNLRQTTRDIKRREHSKRRGVREEGE